MNNIRKFAEVLKKNRIHDFVPSVALILGSGLGGVAKSIKTVEIIDYSEILGMPVSTVDGHNGRFIFGYIENVPVVAMDGRVHLYEGYTTEQAVLPIRLMKLMGAQMLFISNAAGGITVPAASVMAIEDHISLFVRSPLIGKNDDSLGTRFPDMSTVYSRRLLKCLQESAKENNISLPLGVYCQLTGPQFETPAEIRLLKGLGVDAVGMSTVIEAIAAVHCGFEVCAVSCITNLAAGLGEPLRHDDVKKNAMIVTDKFSALIKTAVVKAYKDIKNVEGN